MGNDYLCRSLVGNFGWIAALWPMVAWGAEEERALLVRAPEIALEKRVSSAETSLQHNVAGLFGYSLAVRATPEGRSEVAAGPLVRPLKGLEIGFERSWKRSTDLRNESLPFIDPPHIGAEFDHRAMDARPTQPPVNLGSTGPLKYELQGSRLRVKYYIDEHTVLSMRARYDRVEQKATVWVWLERRF